VALLFDDVDQAFRQRAVFEVCSSELKPVCAPVVILECGANVVLSLERSELDFEDWDL
jgi:hypothetical protein